MKSILLKVLSETCFSLWWALADVSEGTWRTMSWCGKCIIVLPRYCFGVNLMIYWDLSSVSVWVMFCSYTLKTCMRCKSPDVNKQVRQVVSVQLSAELISGLLSRPFNAPNKYHKRVRVCSGEAAACCFQGDWPEPSYVVCVTHHVGNSFMFFGQRPKNNWSSLFYVVLYDPIPKGRKKKKNLSNELAPC